jgi:hypothetical protein
MQVALYPTTFGVGRGYQASPRRTGFDQMRLCLPVQPFIVEGNARRRRDSGDQSWVVGEGWVVCQDGDYIAFTSERRDGPPGSFAWRLNVATVFVDEDLPIGQPQGQLQGRIVQNIRQCRPHTPGRQAAIEFDHQIGDGRPIQPGPGHPHHKPDWPENQHRLRNQASTVDAGPVR